MSSLALKLLAIISMAVDHAGYALYPVLPPSVYDAMRLIGRLAMPIFCFLIAEGYFHTRDVRRYSGRLFLFALLSEVPYDLLNTRGASLLEFSAQNVFFTLAAALAAIWLYDTFAERNQPVPALLSLLACAALCEIFQTDYGAFGVLFVFVFYRFRGQKTARATAFLVCVTVFFLYELLVRDVGLRWSLALACAALAIIPISLYNGEKGYGSRVTQLFFYAFYPAHLLILFAVGRLAG